MNRSSALHLTLSPRFAPTWRGVVAFALILFAAAALPAQQAAFRGLGGLPGAAVYSGASGISGNGCVVVGQAASTAGDQGEAFRWDARSGMVGLGDLPGGAFMSGAWTASADGSVIVGASTSANGREAFRWTRARMVGLGDLPGGDFYSEANSVSADGNVIAGYGISANGQEAFRWTAATGITGLGDLAGGLFASAAAGMSADGMVIVGIGDSPYGNEAVRWNGTQGPIVIGGLPGGDVLSGANGVSSDGTLVVGTDYSELPGQAFVWQAQAGIAGLGFLPGDTFFASSDAFDVSAVGNRIVGSASSATSGPQAFLWDTEHGMRRVVDILTAAGVDMTGWRLSDAMAISDDGRVLAGRGMNPQGQFEAWMAVIPTSADPSFAGDANGDGRVNHADLAIVSANLGMSCGVTFSMGDFNHDDRVTLADVRILQANWNRTQAGAPSAAVPEPSTLALALLGAVGFFARRLGMSK